MAVAYYRSGQMLGWPAVGPASTSQFGLFAAANWGALSFTPDSGRTLSAVRAYVSDITGTLAGSDITCSLYDSTGTGGVPGSAIESGKLPSATITGAGWCNFTGFTTALTAGQMYWLVFKNVNGSPASNWCHFQFITTGLASPLVSDNISSRNAWARGTSTNSGSAWSTANQYMGVRIAYADGSYDGSPCAVAAAAGSGDGVYGSRESGVVFTTPPSGVLKVAGLGMFIPSKTGSPTGLPRFGLWSGSSPSLVAYTNSLPNGIPTTAWYSAYFSSTQTLQPSTTYRATLGETTQSDASGNRFNNQEVSWDTDSNSLALLPFEGTVKKTYFDGSSWSDTSGSIFPFALLLDPAGEFGAGASGAPLSRIFTGY